MQFRNLGKGLPYMEGTTRSIRRVLVLGVFMAMVASLSPWTYPARAAGAGQSSSTPLVRHTGHSGPVIEAEWSPDGKWIASCGNDGTVQVWDAGDANLRWKASIARFAFALAWSPDGTKVAVGGSDGSVNLLDAVSGNRLGTYRGQTAFIEGLAWSPDGTKIATGSQDKTVKVYDAQSGQATVTYTGHTDAVARVAWSPDGKEVASAGHDGTVQVWSPLTGQTTLTYNDHAAPVWSVAWSPDGTRIVSGTGSAGSTGPVTANNSVKVWDAGSGKTLLTYAGHSGQAYGLAWSPDGKSIASGGDGGAVQIWDAQTGQTQLEYRGHSQTVFGVAWSPDGKRIVSTSVDGTVQIWSASASEATPLPTSTAVPALTASATETPNTPAETAVVEPTQTPLPPVTSPPTGTATASDTAIPVQAPATPAIGMPRTGADAGPAGPARWLALLVSACVFLVVGVLLYRNANYKNGARRL